MSTRDRMIARVRMMSRRRFAATVGGVAAWPLVAEAQQAVPIVGFLGGASAARWSTLVAAFTEGLASVGYVDGKNVRIEFRWSEGQFAQLPALAAELVQRNVAVIVATGGAGPVLAAQAATKTIPIVFTLASDPVEHGLVASLGRPGGNITGVTMIAHHLLPKKLELLHALVPKAAKIAILVNPTNPSWRFYVKELAAGAQSLDRQIQFFEAPSERDFGRIFEDIAQKRFAGLLIAADPVFDRNTRLIALTARYSIPTMYTWREDVEAGGLLSYGISIKEAYREAGVYTGRILKGEKPQELPILQPTKVELVVNLKTARALRITFPDSIMLRADEVIE